MCAAVFAQYFRRLASGVYYRDIVGNISTSNLRITPGGVELDLETRFPIFGGWKTQFYTGYTVSAGSYVSSDGDVTTVEFDANVALPDVSC